MSSPDAPSAPTWLSLPPARATDLSQWASAVFAPAIVQAMLHAAPEGGVGAFLAAGDAAFTDARRFALSVTPDPLALLPLTVQLSGLEPEAIASAFTRLLDAPYRGRPWGHYLQSLYFTSCPACGRPTMALAFRWQGTPPVLISRRIRCEFCGHEGETPVMDEDRHRAAEAEPGPTLRWEMMARTAAADDPLRSRAEQVLGFYTPRNLWVLWQSLRILREVSLTQDERRAMQWLLLLALWWGSSLEEQPELLWQNAVRRPRRFVERNLWFVFHDALLAVQQGAGSLRRTPPTRPDEGETPLRQTYHLAQRWPAAARVPSEGLALALIEVPAALPLYWLLRFVWSGWLFGAEAASACHDLLALRPGGGDLLQRLLTDAAEAVLPWLAEGGNLAVQWRWQGEEDPSASILAALPPTVGAVMVAATGVGEYAAAVSVRKGAVAPAVPESFSAVGVAALQRALAERGEPAGYLRLRPHLIAAWRRQGDLPAAKSIEARLTSLLDPQNPLPGLVVWGNGGNAYETGDVPWWWLREPPAEWRPASDLAERGLLHMLEAAPIANLDELGWQLTTALPPACVPDRPWLEALAASYLVQTEEGFSLRAQDGLAVRQQEIEDLARQLLNLGQRFGLDAAAWPEQEEWTVEWQQAGQRRASFLLAATTALTPRLYHSRAPIPGLARFLVLPGSRAGLAQWRIDHQPLWAGAANAGGWTFVKFRHMRDMLRDGSATLNGGARSDAALIDQWLAYLGVDRITASQVEQMRLL